MAMLWRRIWALQKLMPALFPVARYMAEWQRRHGMRRGVHSPWLHIERRSCGTYNIFQGHLYEAGLVLPIWPRMVSAISRPAVNLLCWGNLTGGSWTLKVHAEHVGQREHLQGMKPNTNRSYRGTPPRLSLWEDVRWNSSCPADEERILKIYKI